MGHPQHADTQLPRTTEETADFTQQLENMSKQVLEATTVSEGTTVQLTEDTMENTADGHSTLFKVREGAMDQSSAIKGVANLLGAANSEGNGQESHAELADSHENSEE